MSIYKALFELEQKGGSAVFCEIIRSKGSTPRHVGSKMLVYPDGRIKGTVGGGEMESRVIEEAKKALVDGQARIVSYDLADPERGDPGVCGGQLEIFIEPITPRPTIVVVGAGHVGKAVAHLAKWLDFRVLVSDDRQELCTPDHVPDGDKYYPGPLDELLEDVEITPHTYFILCTRNVEVDVKALPGILETPGSYIGVIGSHRRWATTREKLKEIGIPEEQINRVVSPMGLELNAETPEEIAVSILAEIIMLRRGGEGGPMSSQEGEG